jgi:hypothetical protein
MHRAELVEHEVQQGEGYTRREKRWHEPVLGLTDVTNQHYIPKMYLRGFGDTNERIRVVNLDTGDDGVVTHVRNAGAQRRFNNFQLEGLEVSTEGWLSELEGAADPLLKRLRGDAAGLLDFTFDEEMDLARFLAAFSFRVPGFREMMDRMRAQLLEGIKPNARAYLRNEHKGDEATADRIWEEWEKNPEEWWFQQERPFNHAELTAQMLASVQGYANMLWSMPWRVGRVPSHIRLYTSDNPMHGYLEPIRPWWEHGAFATFWYYVPLSPSVLLRIAPFTYRPQDAVVGDPGARTVRDFGGWDASMALHIQSRGATRFLYGEGGYIGQDEARDALDLMEVSVKMACKLALNWSGDEPPTHKGWNGEETTPAPVSPLDREMARMRKMVHERRHS